MRHLRLVLWLSLTFVLPTARLSTAASWTPGGTPITTAPGAQFDPIVTYGGGFSIVWTDQSSGHRQLMLVDLNGGGWPTGGLVIAPSDSDQWNPAVYGDGSDGSITVVWSEDRALGSGRDLYAQRYQSNGTRVPGWPADGVRVCGAAGDQTEPAIAGSGSIAGAWLVWRDARNGNPDLYSLAIDSNGSPRSGWPVNGTAISTDPADDGPPRLAIAGPNFDRLVIAWSRAGLIMAQSVSAAGVVGGLNWASAGQALSDPAFVASEPAIAVSGNGSLVAVAWQEPHAGFDQVWGRTVSYSGLASAQPHGIADLAGSNHRHPRLMFSSSSNVRSFWEDDRADAGDLYQQLSYASADFGDGFPTYPDTGLAFCVAPGAQTNTALTDFLFWEDHRSAEPQIYVQTIPPQQYWPATGLQVAPTSGAQTHPSAAKGLSQAFGMTYDVVAWTDERDPATAPDIYAMAVSSRGLGEPVGSVSEGRLTTRLSEGRPTPSRGAVAMTIAMAEPGRVRLDIVDVSGRRVAALVDGRLPAGLHELAWNGADARGRPAPPGIYFVRGAANGVELSRRIVRLAP